MKRIIVRPSQLGDKVSFASRVATYLGSVVAPVYHFGSIAELSEYMLSLGNNKVGLAGVRVLDYENMRIGRSVSPQGITVHFLRTLRVYDDSGVGIISYPYKIHHGDAQIITDLKSDPILNCKRDDTLDIIVAAILDDGSLGIQAPHHIRNRSFDGRRGFA